MTIHVIITDREDPDDIMELEDFIVHPLAHQTDTEIAAIIKAIIESRWDTDE